MKQDHLHRHRQPSTTDHVAAGSSPTDEVLARYDELRDLLDSLAARPTSDADAVGAATAWVLREARQLDADRLDDWLATMHPDAVVWVPLRPGSHPATDQSLFLDDHRRLGERVAWRRDPSAWGQQPPSVCTRVIGGVEAWSTTRPSVASDPAAPGTSRVVVARSAFTLDERRHGRAQTLVGHQVHELVGDPLRCRTKILLVPALADGVRNPSFLL